MNKIRILRGEFEGQLMVNNQIVDFWAVRSEQGLSASFDKRDAQDLPDYECFKALEAVVYGY